MEQIKVEGQCENCTCYIGHTLDTDNEICVNCGCDDYSPTTDEDLFNRIKGLRLVEPEIPAVVFFGKMSRECTSCGGIKLYKEFAEPDNADILCNYCIEEALAELDEDYYEDEEESFTCNYCNEVHDPAFCPEVYADQQYMGEWEETYE